MENATKALLIAAAVLIAILIISFSLIIYNMASETIGDIDLSEAEMTQFNNKFKIYDGGTYTPEEFDRICTTIIAHNQQERKNNTNRFVTIVNAGNGNDIVGENLDNMGFVPRKKTYSVVCKYNKGLINKLSVTIKSAE